MDNGVVVSSTARLTSYVMLLLAGVMALTGSLLFGVGLHHAGVLIRSVALALLTVWIMVVMTTMTKVSVTLTRRDSVVIAVGCGMIFASCLIAMFNW